MKKRVEGFLFSFFLYVFLFFLLLTSSCEKASLKIADKSYTHLTVQKPSFVRDSEGLKGLKKVVKEQIVFFERFINYHRETNTISLAYAQEQLETLRLFYQGLEAAHSQEDFYHFVEKNFDYYRSTGADGKVLFTGYYSPVINGSLTQSEKFPYPLYQMPDDLVTIKTGDFGLAIKKTLKGRIQGTRVVPYYSRKEIDEGLGFKGIPLIYVSDPVEAFILHIQGSGFVELQDGSLFPVHYAGANGRPYVSIGKLLIEDKKISRNQMSMQAIRKYFRTYPEDTWKYLYKNPSYIFFKKGDKEGASGSLGIPVRGGRTIAADAMVFPKGSITYIITQRPVFLNKEEKVIKEKFSGFLIDRDSGGAIKGPGRIDIFWGMDEKAEFRAGYMKSYGEIYYLKKKANISDE